MTGQPKVGIGKNAGQPEAGIHGQSGLSVFGTRRYYVFFIIYIAAICAFGSFVNDMYLPSLPSMTRFFHCSVPTVQLGLTMGMIGLGLGEVFLGPLSGRLGRKPVLVVSVSLFAVSAVASVFSPTIQVFVGWRLLQGVGASGGYFLARTIPADISGGRALAKIMALIGAINGFAPASAPVLGGIIDDAWGWRGVFVALTAYALLILAFSPLLKESLPKSRRTTGNFWRTFGNYIILLRNRRFLTHVLLKAAGLGLLFAYASSSPFIYQSHFGFSQTQYGLWMGLNAVAVAAGSMMALRFKYIKTAAGVATIILVPVITLQCVQLVAMDKFWVYEILNVAMLFALGLVFSASNTLAMNEGRQYAGDASAVLGVGGYLFGAVVSPLVGMGNIMVSTAIAYAALSVLLCLFAVKTNRIAPDLSASDLAK